MKLCILLSFFLTSLLSFIASSQNLIPNGSFENDFANWNNLVGGTGAATFSIDTNDKVDSAKAMKVIVTAAGSNAYDIQSINSPWASTSGRQYTLSFYAKADVAGKTLRVVQQTTTYAQMDFSLTTTWQKYEWVFTAQEANLQLRFNFPVTGTFNIDQVSIPVPDSVINLIPNGGFENNFTNWTNLAGGTSSAAFSIETADKVQGSKAMKVAVATAGTNAYDVQSINSAWASVAGKEYTLSFFAKADVAGKTLRVVQQTNTYAQKDFSLTTEWQRYEWIFTAQEANLQLRLNFPVAGTFYIDTISIPAVGTIVTPPPPYTPGGPPLATGKAKFLGSAYSNAQKTDFGKYWNQVTPENGGKWGTVEATRDVMNWTELDSAYKLAKDSGYLFKMHTLIWGSQQPAWIETLDPATQLAEIKQWFQAVASRYPAIDFIEVVNEPLHAKPDAVGRGNYINALGGAGTTGWDWVINAFRLAREYFPTSKLWINDYSIVNSSASTAMYMQIINLLKAQNLIDGVGEQAHAFTTTAPSATITNNLNTLATTGLPLYATELDIDGPPAETPQGDTIQLRQYQRIFPLFWEHPAVKGITLWGFRPGQWRTAEGAPLVYANGAEKAAMVWLKQYLQATVLPVTLHSFEARKTDNKVTLTWTTETETNNAYFEIERSTDGQIYTPLLRVNAHTNGPGIKDYVAYDNNPHAGLNYYRLVQYDIDGQKKYHSIRLVRFGGKNGTSIQVYPNPASSFFTIRTDPGVKGATITISDALGRNIKTFVMPTTGILTVQSANFTNGIYYVRVKRNGETKTSKMVINKK
jgi:GH35 family endo-1,4-beta-xylanase